MLVAEGAVFFERLVDDALELGGQRGVKADRCYWRVIEDAIENFGGTVATERGAASRHFIEDYTEAEKIAASIEVAAAGLFGRHVSDGAESGAGAGEIGGIERVLVAVAPNGSGGFNESCGFGGDGFGQAEIENFCLIARSDEEIGGLDVAMDDAFGMSGIESVGNLDGKRKRFVKRKRTAGDGVFESAAIEKLHDDEGMCVVFADFVDGANVGVIQGRGGLRFALKAFESLQVAGDAVGKEFKSDEAVELGVFGFVDNAHPAAAEFFDDTEMGNAAADQTWGIRHEGTILVRWQGTVNERRCWSSGCDQNGAFAMEAMNETAAHG